MLIYLKIYIFGSQRRLYYTIYQKKLFKMWRDHRKKNYERRVYESVDDRSLFWDISLKSMGSRYQEPKGYIYRNIYALSRGC